eukprot:CAMPEP_0172478776 /NCGR_PEP_ID=MMETSP1066-20121228/2947_1 /TAXON_ID=671091 /ORGANISM="Coscinodiscus wailesii, Strain CCMP2513" /LENGTH=107 /DNA_ID=CAMNT_0013238627 /DNA_START=93 /DNA_END=413 /DNA_ORIENTATION=+
MKFNSSIIVLFAIQTATAFVHPPLPRTINGNTVHFSYLGSLNENTGFKESAQDGTRPAGPALANVPESPGPGSSLEPSTISWQDLPLVKVQGGALRTWSLTDPNVER